MDDEQVCELDEVSVADLLIVEHASRLDGTDEMRGFA